MADYDSHIAVGAAIAAVRAAGELCAGVQGRLRAGDTITTGDDSPVTVADFAAQAVRLCGPHRGARRGGARSNDARLDLDRLR